MNKNVNLFFAALLFLLLLSPAGPGWCEDPQFTLENGIRNVTSLDQLQTVYQKTTRKHDLRYLILSTMGYCRKNRIGTAPSWLADILRREMRSGDAQLALNAIAAACDLGVKEAEDSLARVYLDARMKYVGDMEIIRNAAASALARSSSSYAVDRLRGLAFAEYPEFEDAAPALLCLLRIQISPDSRSLLDSMAVMAKNKLDECIKAAGNRDHCYCTDHYGGIINRFERTQRDITVGKR
jgi:hypothetical protein